MKGFLQKLIWISVLNIAFHSTLYASIVELRTEDYPPFNMITETKEISGYSTIVVKEMFKRAGIAYNLRVWPWERAYELTLQTQDFGIFSTTRTPERESLFKWVGPIANGNWVLLAKKSRAIHLKDLQDAKAYIIGGYRGDAISNYLQKEQNFSLTLAASPTLNARMLEVGHIDLWPTGQLSGPFLAKKEGIVDLEVVLKLKEIDLYLAFNKNTSDEIISKLQKALETMKQDGSYDKILKTIF